MGTLYVYHYDEENKKTNNLIPPSGNWFSG